MVYICLLVVVWAGRPPLVYECNMPPVVLLSTSAASMYYALSGHPQYQRLLVALELIRARAMYTFRLFETDAASGNLKLVAHLIASLPGEDLTRMAQWSPCFSHQTHHIEISLIAMGASARCLLGDIYAMCLFLTAKGYYSRLRTAVPSWLQSFMIGKVRWGQPVPETSRRLSQCIIDFFQSTSIFDEAYRHDRRDARWRNTIKADRRNGGSCTQLAPRNSSTGSENSLPTGM